MKQNFRRMIAVGVSLAAMAACDDYGTDPVPAPENEPTVLAATGNIAATVEEENGAQTFVRLRGWLADEGLDVAKMVFGGINTEILSALRVSR